MSVKKHRDLRIANMFMLAKTYDEFPPSVPCIVMPKLNGLRAMYIPGRGFFTRDGISYNHYVLGHIRIHDDVIVDGELYVHGWSLQRINSAVGVNLIAPVPDSRAVKFHAFDVIESWSASARRLVRLSEVIAHSFNVEPVRALYTNPDRFDVVHDENVAAGYEGSMYKHVNAPYTPGRTERLVKRKNWQFADVVVLNVREGEGKFRGMFGGAQVIAVDAKLPADLHFNVGVGKDLTDAVRREIWREPNLIIGKPFRARYLTLSDDGVPQNSTIKIEL